MIGGLLRCLGGRGLSTATLTKCGGLVRGTSAATNHHPPIAELHRSPKSVRNVTTTSSSISHPTVVLVPSLTKQAVIFTCRTFSSSHATTSLVKPACGSLLAPRVLPLRTTHRQFSSSTGAMLSARPLLPSGGVSPLSGPPAAGGRASVVWVPRRGHRHGSGWYMAKRKMGIRWKETFATPSIGKCVKKHGREAMWSTPGHRMILARRWIKGRWRLHHH